MLVSTAKDIPVDLSNDSLGCFFIKLRDMGLTKLTINEAMDLLRKHNYNHEHALNDLLNTKANSEIDNSQAMQNKQQADPSKEQSQKKQQIRTMRLSLKRKPMESFDSVSKLQRLENANVDSSGAMHLSNLSKDLVSPSLSIPSQQPESKLQGPDSDLTKIMLGSLRRLTDPTGLGSIRRRTADLHQLIGSRVGTTLHRSVLILLEGAWDELERLAPLLEENELESMVACVPAAISLLKSSEVVHSQKKNSSLGTSDLETLKKQAQGAIREGQVAQGVQYFVQLAQSLLDRLKYTRFLSIDPSSSSSGHRLLENKITDIYAQHQQKIDKLSGEQRQLQQSRYL